MLRPSDILIAAGLISCGYALLLVGSTLGAALAPIIYG